MKKLSSTYFNCDALQLAKKLIGKIIVRKHESLYLYAQITETEAYYLEDKASHASLGWTQKRHALFMPAGTIYMYYARGSDSLNISAKGKGNAVLIKSAQPYMEMPQAEKMIPLMQRLNPLNNGGVRLLKKLCCGQTLLCKALNIKVKEWDQQQFNDELYIADSGYRPKEIIQTTRRGIPPGRDEHLLYRCVDGSVL